MSYYLSASVAKPARLVWSQKKRDIAQVQLAPSRNRTSGLINYYISWDGTLAALFSELKPREIERDVYY